MNPLQLLLFMIAGGLFNLIPKNSAYTVILARIFFYLSCFIILSYIALYFSGIHEQHVLSILTNMSKYAYLIWIVLLGYLAVNISRNDFRSLYVAEHPDKKVVFLNTLYGLSVMIGCIFIIATIGKSQNFKQMSDFFKLSGYAIWFLYFIMVVEAAGGLGILLHRYLKTGLLAALGLFLIMLGAVYTHWHNHDPFSDSYAAVAQMVNLSLLIFCYYRQKQFGQLKYAAPALHGVDKAGAAS